MSDIKDHSLSLVIEGLWLHGFNKDARLLEKVDAQLAALREENERLRRAKLEPVLYQYRMRPTWENDSKFGAWDDCSEASYLQYQAQRIYGDWEYQSRALYAAEPDLDALKARVAELEDFARFMCSTWAMIESFVYKNCSGDQLMQYPVIQGSSNQIKLMRIGEQPFRGDRVIAAVEGLLKEPANEG